MGKEKRNSSEKHPAGNVVGDISWGQWTKQRWEDYEKNKKTSEAKQPLLDNQSEVIEMEPVSPEQQKRKRKEHKKNKESLKGELGKNDLANPSASYSGIHGNSTSVPITETTEQDTADTQRKKKKKMKHKEVNHEEMKEAQNSSDSKQMEGNVDQQETSEKLSEEKNNSVQNIVPRSMLTMKKHKLKLFLATQGMNFTEWKEKKKEEYRLWREEQLVKKLERFKESSAPNSTKGDTEETMKNGKNYTVSIALPGSILDNAQSPELKTYLAGQIARAAAVFKVNEIVIFEETGNPSALSVDQDAPIKLRQKHGSIQLIKILQFMECPQYLRRYFFPLQNDLMFAGVLNPLDMPHHLRINDVSPYREGVTLNKPIKDGKGSFVYIGFPKSAVIDKAIEPNVRVTVKLDEKFRSKKHYSGVAVSPSTPYKQDGIYWGYSVRLAESLGAVFSKCPYKEGYDLTIGTSEKGSDVDQCVLPSFKHLLIVFGGLKGLEASLEADEKLTVDDPSFLFHHYLNTCPSQGARTIRTEEAILITLSVLRPKILQCQSPT